MKKMEIAYKVGDGLYINLTNKCSSACTFCLRQGDDKVGESDSLWLEREPTVEEATAAIEEKLKSYDYKEIVFCGFGEPTCVLDTMLSVAKWVKQNTAIRTRLNTNGQADLINSKDVAPLLVGLIDTVSISLNVPDAERYQALVRSRFGVQSYDAMITFAKRCVEEGLDVVMTTVETTISKEDEEKSRQLCQSIGARYRIREWVDDGK
ncbi:MAG: radical SAM protein [Paludibacteraceae bacterium]|nr:radical SAM protein [Paludibacteraceae bacterium]MBQ7748667.1 radical SAM protein [Paludibacteraceae bacterium]